VLASGFLFTALIIIPHALSFRGAFTPMGLLGAKLQTTAWLYNFWKAGLPLTVILYVLLKDANGGPGMSERSSRSIILGSVAVAIAIVCGLTWIAAVEEGFLLASDGTVTLGPPYAKTMELGWQPFALSLIASEVTDEDKEPNLRFLHDLANFNFVTTAQGKLGDLLKRGRCNYR
jgi:hypothetical protein